MERKKLIELIGSVFVALIFLSSYAAFGNISQSGSNATTTASTPQTFYGSAIGNATITSYSNAMSINITCKNVSSVSGPLNSALTNLEKNGSVSTFSSFQASQIAVDAGSLSTYPLFLQLAGDAGQGESCTAFTTSANINLPSRMSFHIPPQPGITNGQNITITIPSSLQTGSIAITLERNMSTKLRVQVDAAIAVNGSIYGGLRVAQV